MQLKHMAILVILLVGSDLLIGFYGHYTGSSDDELTASNFFNYIMNKENQDELLVVFVFALIIVAIMHFVLKVG